LLPCQPPIPLVLQGMAPLGNPVCATRPLCSCLLPFYGVLTTAILLFFGLGALPPPMHFVWSVGGYLGRGWWRVSLLSAREETRVSRVLFSQIPFDPLTSHPQAGGAYGYHRVKPQLLGSWIGSDPKTDSSLSWQRIKLYLSP